MIALTICIIGGTMCLPAFAATNPQQSHVFEIYIPQQNVQQTVERYAGYERAAMLVIPYSQQTADASGGCDYTFSLFQDWEDDNGQTRGTARFTFCNYYGTGAAGDFWYEDYVAVPRWRDLVSDVALRHNAKGVSVELVDKRDYGQGYVMYYYEAGLQFRVQKGYACHYTIFLSSENSVFLALQSGFELDDKRDEIEQNLHDQLKDAFNDILCDAGFDGAANFDPYLGSVVLHHLWVNGIVLGLLITAVTCALGYHVVFRSHL